MRAVAIPWYPDQDTRILQATRNTDPTTSEPRENDLYDHKKNLYIDLNQLLC